MYVKATDIKLYAGGTNELLLNTIYIKSEHGNGTLGTHQYTGDLYAGEYVALTSNWVKIVDAGDTDTDYSNSGTRSTVIISYQCGVTNPVVGENPDYYSVELVFQVSPDEL